MREKVPTPPQSTRGSLKVVTPSSPTSNTPVAETLKRLEVDAKTGLTPTEAGSRLTKYGRNTIEEKKKSAIALFLAYFWGPIPWMIEAAALMALIVRDWGDFIIIASLLFFNAALGFWQEHEASDALDTLKRSLALKARVLRSGSWAEVNVENLVPGDIVRLYLGDVVPGDCQLVEGNYLSIDQSALTGESLPVSKSVGDDAYSGSIVKRGEMVAVVTATGSNTYFGRTAKLVASAGNASHFQKAIMGIGDFLIVLALLLAVILVADRLYDMRASVDSKDLLRLAEFVLILLVASVPVAMPAVLSVTMALGARKLAQKKAIVSRLESIEELAGVTTLCSDKTGTLTQNKLALGEPETLPGGDPENLVLMGSLASRTSDNDPIDLAVIAGLKTKAALTDYQQKNYVPFDPVGKRTEATIQDPDGKTFRVTKGAPQVILALSSLSDTELTTWKGRVDEFAEKGYRTLGVARADVGGAWKFLGILPLSDPPRPDSKETIARAVDYGVTVKMVTGDNVAIAKQVAAQLGMDTNIQPASTLFPGDVTKGQIPLDASDKIEHADGFAEVFPEHKFAIVKVLQETGQIVGMTGDGVNDAPALKQADVGIAVSGATEAARAAAALILTAPGLSVIIDGIGEARRIFERMMSYVLYRIAMTIDIMVFVVLASVFYGFFPLTPIMIIALALLDDVPVMTIAFDNARVPSRPVRWQMRQVLVISLILGLLASAQSFGLFYIGDTVFHLDRPYLQTMMFLQLVAGGHLLLFLTRSRGAFWKTPHPGAKLLFAILATQVAAVFMCGLGVVVPALPWKIVGWVWVYNLCWMAALDGIKVGLYSYVESRESGKNSFLRKMQDPLDAHRGLQQRHRNPKAA